MATLETNERAYDNLVVPGVTLLTERATLLSGQDVVRGTALGKITASGKLRTWGGAGSDDGHRTFYAIAAEDADATGGDVGISVYLKGAFYKSNVTIDGDQTADDVEDIVSTARDIGIFLVENASSQT